jgi:hypothetical protein
MGAEIHRLHAEAAVAQAVSRRVPAVEAQVRAQGQVMCDS